MGSLLRQRIPFLRRVCRSHLPQQLLIVGKNNSSHVQRLANQAQGEQTCDGDHVALRCFAERSLLLRYSQSWSSKLGCSLSQALLLNFPTDLLFFELRIARQLRGLLSCLCEYVADTAHRFQALTPYDQAKLGSSLLGSGWRCLAE